MVASLADAWIKIAHNSVMNRGDIVVSYMGTWIKKLKGKIENFNIPLSVAKCFLKIFSTENGSY